MNNFHAKSKKQNVVTKRTLDIQHLNFVNKLNSMKLKIVAYEKELELLQSKINAFKKLQHDQGVSDEQFDSHLKDIDSRIEITARLKQLKHDFDETQYYINTGDILFKYYSLLEKKGDQFLIDSDSKPSQTILKYFVQKEKTTDENVDDSRGKLLEKYLTYTDNNFISKHNRDVDETCGFCNSRNITVMLHDGYAFCNECNTMEFIIIDHDKPSYKDPPKEISYFAYKRINHFQEWLNQIQAKETTEIPDEVYDQILLEIKKQRITNMASLNHEKIKEILRKLRINKYEHSSHIINRLSGLPMPHLTPELEEKLRNMFKQIQTPFLKWAPPNRKNFLSYAYVLHKFMQLLDKDEYLIYFPLLKARDKLNLQDQIWEKICNELGWQFLPSM